MMKLRYYFAYFMGKMAYTILKLIGRKATQFPGDIAIKICPLFLQYVKKPSFIIGVTGTNGKTTVCNLLNDILTLDNKLVLINSDGSNMHTGLASLFLKKWEKYDLAILEIDERSSKYIFPYINFDYLLCTNLFRDSLDRNVHAIYMRDLLDKYISKTTTLILNADDLISSSIGENNKKIYFGISKLKTDSTESKELVKDITLCPKCSHKLKYKYVKYHHIGNAYCVNCDFTSPKSDYQITNVDSKKSIITVNENQEYHLISNSVFNMYNELCVITVLKILKYKDSEINNLLNKVEITDKRYKMETLHGIDVVMHVAKGKNAVACSRVFDYIDKQLGNKIVILNYDDYFDAIDSSENITWIYESDYEFLNNDQIKQIIVSGPRYMDQKLRLLIGGINKEKISGSFNEVDVIKNINLEGINKVFILYDLYTVKTATKQKNAIMKYIGECYDN